MAILKLDLEWRTTLLTALLLPALVWLGFWQLDRADEKVALAEQNTRRATAAPRTLTEIVDLSAAEVAYRQVSLSGHFVSFSTAFLDNQMRDGRYGHDVLSVFIDDSSGRALWLNRGWVPGDSSRRSLPEVDAPEGQQQLIASVYVPPGEPYLLAEETFSTLEWPLLIQSSASEALNVAIELELGQPVYPYELRLLADQPGGYRRDWPLVNVSPQKHRGYAVQWFTMAAALLVLFVLRSSNVLSVLRGQAGTTSRPSGEN